MYATASMRSSSKPIWAQPLPPGPSIFTLIAQWQSRVRFRETNSMVSLPAPQILFLDDAPERAAAFLAAHPSAVWVRTVEQCIELLEQPWDEVHLDHDLGGEVLVDHERADCRMAVVRWLCEESRPHLRETRFIIHTHNPNAACMMVLHLQVMGFPGPGKPVRRRDPDWTRCEPQILAGRLLRWLGQRTGPIV